MRYSSLREEKKLWKKGYKRVACLDEAGRGPLAGPVTAAAVVVVSRFRLQASGLEKIKDSKAESRNGGTKVKMRTESSSPFKNLRDSKKLSAKQREKFYKLIRGNKNIKWGIGIVSEKVIDKINILEATKLAMKKAVKKIKKKPDFLILDGNIKLNLKIPQKSIIKADEKVFSCALASILAKVTRDRMMIKYHQKYPKYRFDLHKGYPTKFHRKMLKKYGPCRIHRRSFTPVKGMIK